MSKYYKQIETFTARSTLTTDAMNVIRENLEYLKQRTELDSDALWERMYIAAKRVIVSCRYCGAHNAITNPVCVQCGAALPLV